MRLCLIFTCLAVLFLGGCLPQSPSQSDLFQQIFLDDSSSFRGAMIGDQIHTVLEHEQDWVPSHQDKLGISYSIPLDDEFQLLVDYYSDNLKTDKESNRLTSIVANILLQDEVEAAKLYSEVQIHFDQRFGLASGQYGDHQWGSSNPFTSSIEVRLRLNDDKQGITLNFIDTEPKIESL